jgi:hypothetical protein
MSFGHLYILTMRPTRIRTSPAPIPKGVTSPSPVTTTLRIAFSDEKVVDSDAITQRALAQARATL